MFGARGSGYFSDLMVGFRLRPLRTMVYFIEADRVYSLRVYNPKP